MTLIVKSAPRNKVAIGQICSTASMSHNLAQCQNLVRRAVAAGAKALFLPEASDYIGSTPAESVSLAQPVTESVFVQGLQSCARQNQLHINVGIHEPTDPKSGRIKNTLIWIDGRGEIVHRYQKLHLFDVDLRDTGGSLVQESQTTEPGDKIEEPYTGLQRKGLGKIGSLICFDLRFAEPALRLRRLGADVLVYPSAFTVSTGQAHWEALLRGRAVEMQCWVVAAAQCGRHNANRVSYGDSLVVNPRGEVVGRLQRVLDVEDENLRDDGTKGSRDEDLLVVDMDMDVVNEVRKSMPLWEMRRTDVDPVI